MGVLFLGQPSAIQELLTLTKTLTLVGHIPYAFLAPSTLEVERMEDILQFCQHLMFYVSTSTLM